LTAYCWNRAEWPGGAEKPNVITQLCERILVGAMSSIVVLVSSVPLNVVGSAVVLTVVPETPVQLTDTSTTGGALNWSDLACHSYAIRHTSVASSSTSSGRTTSHTGSTTNPFGAS